MTERQILRKLKCHQKWHYKISFSNKRQLKFYFVKPLLMQNNNSQFCLFLVSRRFSTLSDRFFLVNEDHQTTWRHSWTGDISSLVLKVFKVTFGFKLLIYIVLWRNALNIKGMTCSFYILKPDNKFQSRILKTENQKRMVYSTFTHVSVSMSICVSVFPADYF